MDFYVEADEGPDPYGDDSAFDGDADMAYSPATGLLPDFFEPVSASDPNLRPASPDFLEGPNDGFYYYNALRVPFRIGVDALLAGDHTSRLQARPSA